MATILLVEDALDIGVYESGLLEQKGHVVLRCRGSFGPFGSCALARDGSCPIPEGADVLVFSHGLYSPVDPNMRGDDLLRAYRRHPRYGALPCLVVTMGEVGRLDGSGPLRVIPKYSDPRTVVAKIEDLLRDLRVPSEPGYDGPGVAMEAECPTRGERPDP